MSRLALVLCVFVLHQSTSVTWDQAQRQSETWYRSADAVRIAENVRLYQRRSGGWPKNIDMAAPLAAADRERLQAEKSTADSTIDNSATVTQIRYLARVFAAAPQDWMRSSLQSGLDYLLDAQYPNGGWPQYFPLRAGYYTHITYNDDAMVGVMTLLRDVAKATPPMNFADDARRRRASEAVARGVALTLRLQIRVNGRLTGWCQQYDERTFVPTGARTYEHASIASRETVGIVQFLNGIESPSGEVLAAIDAAIAWLKLSQLTGLRIERRPDPTGPQGYDLVVVEDPTAPPLWARFYDMQTNKPIYSGRDGVIKDRLSEIEIERRTGYSWIGAYATALLAQRAP